MSNERKRHLKFRAWDPAKRIMISGLSLFHQNNNQLYETNGLVITQSTGLFDKNGTEIFEGDLVRFAYKTEKVVCKIIWQNENAMFCLQWKNGYVNHWHLNPENYEVIGNVFENEEMF
jgi:uncharacterized phage protein (TIGR01671 family)